jgi:thiamine biosynthesis lipoprotein
VTDGVRRELEMLDVLVGRDGGTVSATATTPSPSTSAVSRLDTGRDRTRLLMDSLLRIQVRDGDDATASAAIDAAFADVARLEDLLSTWRETTPASALNRNAGGDLLEVPPELSAILATSLSLDHLTGGAFDITVGPVASLWRRSAKLGTWPGTEEIDAARARTGATVVELDAIHSRARLSVAHASIDLGGIGKGYALDRARAVLEGARVHVALLDFGGQMLALDPPPGERAWRIELRDPRHPERTLVGVDLVRASLSSSADYERGVEIAGRRVSHVVDPRTGMPVEGMIGTSVIRPTATEADALSTALFVMGQENGLKFAQEHGYSALLVDASGTVVVTGGFPEVGPSLGPAAPFDAAGSKLR